MTHSVRYDMKKKLEKVSQTFCEEERVQKIHYKVARVGAHFSSYPETKKQMKNQTEETEGKE